jgi:hypothetical protein
MKFHLDVVLGAPVSVHVQFMEIPLAPSGLEYIHLLL